MLKVHIGASVLTGPCSRTTLPTDCNHDSCAKEGGRIVRSGRGTSIRHVGYLGLALCTAVIGFGCEDGPAREDRYAHRFVPHKDGWLRESEMPAMPQEFPFLTIWELSRFAPGAAPTSDQQRAADDLIERSHAAARAHGWDDYESGLADGFRLLPGDDRHYMSDEFLLDDRILDPQRPEFLMYYRTRKGIALTGFMFFVRSAEDRGPQLGGPLTVWHYHVWTHRRCFRDGVVAMRFLMHGEDCPGGEAGYRSPEMMHVWLVDHPDGPFATRMHVDPTLLPDLLEKRMRERGY